MERFDETVDLGVATEETRGSFVRDQEIGGKLPLSEGIADDD